MQVQIDTSDSKRVANLIKNMDLKKHDREIKKLVKASAKPIVTAAKRRASSKIKNTKTFIFSRNGTKYEILPGTVKKSIGVLPLRRASSFVAYVGYRAKSPYDGWFAHFLDAGTKERSGKSGGGSRGKIEPHNIMKYGEQGFPRTSEFLKRGILRLEKRVLSK